MEWEQLLIDQQLVVIYLKEAEGDRQFPILIGIFEATSIDRRVKDYPAPRPLTHDLLGSVISSLGATVGHVIVSDLSNDTFFAKLVLNLTDGSEMDVDCRPSDAIAVAVRGGQLATGTDGQQHWFPSIQEAQAFVEQLDYASGDERGEVRSKVPIFVEDGVLDKAGIVMDADAKNLGDGIAASGQGRQRPSKSVTSEEIEKMSAFSDFLQDLPGLEDIGQQSGS